MPPRTEVEISRYEDYVNKFWLFSASYRRPINLNNITEILIIEWDWLSVDTIDTSDEAEIPSLRTMLLSVIRNKYWSDIRVGELRAPLC